MGTHSTIESDNYAWIWWNYVLPVCCGVEKFTTFHQMKMLFWIFVHSNILIHWQSIYTYTIWNTWDYTILNFKILSTILLFTYYAIPNTWVNRYRFCLLLWFYVFPNSPKQYEIQVLLCTQHHFYIDSTPFSVSTLLPFKSFAVFHLTQ